MRIKKTGKWSYQLDESTDTGKNAQLMVYVRYEGKTDLEKEFLFCTPPTTTATRPTSSMLWTTSNKKKALSGKTASVYAPTALQRCLLLDRSLLHGSSKSILMFKLFTVFCIVKILLRNTVSKTFLINARGCCCNQLYQIQRC